MQEQDTQGGGLIARAGTTDLLWPLDIDDTWLDCRKAPRADMARGLAEP